MALISRKDPPVSEAQRRAMRAAESGHSNLGIPKSVGEDFSKADPGGKLPEKKRSDAGPPEGGSRTSAGYLGGRLPKMDQAVPSIPPQPGQPMNSATFDDCDLKGYMDSVRRGDAIGMARRAASWRK